MIVRSALGTTASDRKSVSSGIATVQLGYGNTGSLQLRCDPKITLEEGSLLWIIVSYFILLVTIIETECLEWVEQLGKQYTLKPVFVKLVVALILLYILDIPRFAIDIEPLPT